MTVDLKTPVPLLVPSRMHEPFAEELKDAFARVMASGRFILGEEVTSFEEEVAQYLGVKHAVGVSSGTDALLVAMMALGIQAGDEVICPTYTFFATAGSIWRLGAKPVFTDIDPVTFNMTPEHAAEHINDKTKAIMPVHLFGQCCDVAQFNKVAQKHKIDVIEDAAQAIGASVGGESAGAQGSFGCFSFFPAKNLGAFGDAGLVTTNDDELADRARKLRTHGGQDKYENHLVGGNFRIDALQAALLRVKLKHLDGFIAARRHHASIYRERFEQAGLTGGNDHPIRFPQEVHPKHAFNQFVIRLQSGETRDNLRAFLKENNTLSAVYYPKPLHQQDCFAALGHKAGDFPVAEACARDTLALPIAAELTDQEIELAADRVIHFLSNRS